MSGPAFILMRASVGAGSARVSRAGIVAPRDAREKGVHASGDAPPAASCGRSAHSAGGPS